MFETFTLMRVYCKSLIFVRSFSTRSPSIRLTNIILQDKKKRSEVAADIINFCKEFGFFYLSAEDIVSSDLLAQSYYQSYSFHKLKDEIKCKYRTTLDKNSRGWVPMFAEPSYEPGKISYVESFDLALDVPADDPLSALEEVGPNVWPDELPKFKYVITELYDNTTKLADFLFELFAEGLNLPSNTFLQYATRKRRSHMRLLHYPGDTTLSNTRASVPVMITSSMKMTLLSLGYTTEQIKSLTPEVAHNLITTGKSAHEYKQSSYPNNNNNNIVTDNPIITEKVGISSHTDFECFTLLHQSASGLQVLTPSGDWIEVDPPTYTDEMHTEPSLPFFTVFIGDMIERWTNGYLRATPHRVPFMKHERYSIVRFNGVDSDTLVFPLQPFISDSTLDEREGESTHRYPPVTQGAHISAMMKDGLLNLRDLVDAGAVPSK